MNTKYVIIWISFLVILTSYFGCSENNQSQTQPENKNLEKYFSVGDSLIIDLDQLEDISSPGGSSNYVWNTPFKMLGFIDGGCSLCAYKLSKWKKFIEEVEPANPIELIIIATGNSVESVKYIAQDEVDYPYPIFFDETNHVKQQNRIVEYSDHQGILLDKQNMALFIGNPWEDEAFIHLYTSND